ncbi:MAG: DnaJ domain-containing protein [Bacteroidales bacterium]
MDYSVYYKLLGISPGADEEQIRQAYRRMALKLHPDVNSSPDAHQEFVNLGEAYEILSRRVRQEGPPGAEYSWPTAEDRSDFASWEEIIREARERARKQAEMRFEKMQRENEAFRQSGLYDLALILRYVINGLVILITAGLLALPVYVAIAYDPWAMLYLIFAWIMGGFLAFYIYSHRKTWFRLGKFYFDLETLKELFRAKPVEGNQDCYFCPGQKADGPVFEQTLLKVQDVMLKMGGPMVQQAQYKRSYKTIRVPRSRKAFLVHFTASLIKLLCLLSFLFFIRPGSPVWSFIIGATAGGILSGFLMLLTWTRPKNLFLINPIILIKLSIWLSCLFLVSNYQHGWHIYTGPYIYLTVAILMFFLDVVIDPVLRSLLGQRAITSFFPLPPQEKALIRSGFQYYLEIPIWSTIYPIIRWLL